MSNKDKVLHQLSKQKLILASLDEYNDKFKNADGSTISFFERLPIYSQYIALLKADENDYNVKKPWRPLGKILLRAIWYIFWILSYPTLFGLTIFHWFKQIAFVKEKLSNWNGTSESTTLTRRELLLGRRESSLNIFFQIIFGRLFENAMYSSTHLSFLTLYSTVILALQYLVIRIIVAIIVYAAANIMTTLYVLLGIVAFALFVFVFKKVKTKTDNWLDETIEE